MPVSHIMFENQTTLDSAWKSFKVERPTYASERTRRQGFLRWAARKTGLELADITTTVVFCSHCELVKLASSTQDGQNGPICTDCRDQYAECDHCKVLTLDVLQVLTLEQTKICPRCTSRSFSYCQTCGGHYERIYRPNHRHGVRSCCASSQHIFSIPHVGHEPLQNDTRVSVSLPKGEISVEGIERIRQQIVDQAYACYDRTERVKWNELSVSFQDLGTHWQTKQGNYAKRLSSLAYKKHGLKMPPTFMTHVGNIARDNSHGVDFNIEVTRELNRGARQFGYAGSCWWQSYSRSRCALKTNGGFALRCFNEYGVAGRVWVMPLKNGDYGLTPTYETMTPDAYVLFNGYGDMGGYVAPRVLSRLTGMTYRRINFYCQPMYVNSSRGYLVASEELAKDYTDGSVTLDLPQHSSLWHNELTLARA